MCIDKQFSLIQNRTTKPSVFTTVTKKSLSVVSSSHLKTSKL